MNALSAENLTPYKISICILIQIYLNNKINTNKFLPLLHWLITEIQESTGYQECTLQELVGILEGLPEIGPPVAKQLLEQLKEMKDPDSLFTFFQDIQDLIHQEGDHADDDSKVEKSSMFGIFFRKMVLIFDTCMFAAQSRLFANLQRFKADDGYRGELSQRHLRQIINKKATELHVEAGRYSFCEMEEKVRHLSALTPLVHTPQASFLAYLNCLHHREFEGALKYLHQYFDYFGAQQQTSSTTHTGGRTNYIQHHASLNLAVLYYGFGHLDQALRSLEETVRLAQQNGSSECLLHAIALLATISSAKGCRWDTAHAFRLLNRCVQSNMAAEAGRNKKSEASEEKENKTEHKQSDSALGVQVRSWLALANLTLEKLIPAKTDSNDPSSNPLHVWHALTQASRISHQITGSSSSQGSDLSLRARAWNLYGHQELSKLSSEALLTHHTNTGSSLDMSLALANLAQIADIHGVHNLSSSILEASQARYPFHGEGAAEVAFSLRFKAAADKKDLTGAKRIARNWFALSQTHAASQPYVVQMLFAEARLHLLEGRAELAHQSLVTLLAWCEKHGQYREAVTIMLALIQLFQDYGHYLSSLPLILKCLSFTQSFTLESDQAEVLLALARVHLHMDSGALGLAVVRQVLPHILEHCPKWLQCEAYIIQAQCLLSMAKGGSDSKAFEPSTGSSTHESFHVLRAINILKQASDIHSQINHHATGKQLYYLLARAYDYAGNVEARNAAALQFSKF